MILDASTEHQLDDPALGLSGSKSVDVRGQVTPSKTYQNALTGYGGFAALRRLGKGKSLGGTVMGTLLSGAHAPGYADYLFNPATAMAQSRVDGAWLRNARANDLFEQPYSFAQSRGAPPARSAPMSTKQSASPTLPILGGITRPLRAGIAHTPGALGLSDRMRYYLGRTNPLNFNKTDWGREGRRLEESITGRQARTREDIRADLLDDIDDKLFGEYEGFRNPYGQAPENFSAALLNSNGPLWRPLDTIFNPAAASVGLPARDAYERRSTFMRELEIDGLVSALKNPKALGELKRALPENMDRIGMATAAGGAGVLGAGATALALSRDDEEAPPPAPPAPAEPLAKMSAEQRRQIPVTEVRQLSMWQAHNWATMVKASHVYALAAQGGWRFAPPSTPGEKASSGPTALDSMLDKNSNLQALQREMQGLTPYPIPGLSDGKGPLQQAWDERPEWLGGKTKFERGVGALKDLIVRDELIMNASGVPIGRKQTMLPGMSGRLLRLPIALAGVAGIAAAADAYQDHKQDLTRRERFQSAVRVLQEDQSPSGRYVAELLDPSKVDPSDPDSIRAHRQARDMVTESFKLLDRYAPSLTEDPKTAAGYMQGFLQGDGSTMGAMTPDQYMAQVQTAANLESTVRRNNQNSLLGQFGSLAGGLLSRD